MGIETPQYQLILSLSVVHAVKSLPLQTEYWWGGASLLYGLPPALPQAVGRKPC
jgi:hypothetical protein